MPSQDEILAVILGGGRGSRLYPLTKMRSKPAVPMAGKYRLIDIPISNCINSGIFRIAILTQFNSVSLHRHIYRNYQFDNFHTGWVQIWAAEQTMQNADWYQGTADAVRKQLGEIQSSRAKHVLILAGDHLYRMDYAAMANFHMEHKADITVAVQPVAKDEANRFGILKRNPEYLLTEFAEKPRDPRLLEELVSRDDPERPYLGSMGIYLFKTEVLLDLLNNYPLDDFGSHVIPQAITTHTVYGFDFNGYWEDIGTIRSFYETNLALTRTNPPFDFYDATAPIYGGTRFLPCTVVHDSQITNVLLAEGSTINHAEIHDSIIGLRSQIARGAKIENSIIMGADYFTNPEIDGKRPVPLGIGENTQIEGAIVDKNACIGKNVVIRSFPRGTDLDSENWVVRDGIVVIPKNGILMDGTYIGPGSKD